MVMPGCASWYCLTLSRGLPFGSSCFPARMWNRSRPKNSRRNFRESGSDSLMLAEVVGMSADPELAEQSRTALARAVDLILKAQDLAKGGSQAGGWRYQPTSRDSDLSVSGWQVMALRAAKSAGCAVPSGQIDKAVAYVKKCAVKDGGFGYQPGGGPNNPRTGTGILALEIFVPYRRYAVVLKFLAFSLLAYVVNVIIIGPHGLTLLRIDSVSAVPDAITSIYVSVLRVQRRLRFAALRCVRRRRPQRSPP